MIRHPFCSHHSVNKDKNVQTCLLLGNIKQRQNMLRWARKLKDVESFMHRLIFGLIGSVMATLSYADNCDKTRDGYDDVFCTNKVYLSADTDLNKNYQLLRKYLNETQQKILKKSQLAWIRYRDVECSEDLQSAANIQCRLSMTQERNNWLQERLRECEAGACKTTRLSE